MSNSSYVAQARALIKEYEIVGATESDVEIIADSIKRDGIKITRKLLDIGMKLDS